MTTADEGAREEGEARQEPVGGARADRSDDLLGRYKWFSEQCCCMNECLSAVRPWIDRAYAGDPARKEYVFLTNDLALFIMQVFAFDGFLTACLGRLGLCKEGSVTDRLQRIAGAELKRDSEYEKLLAGVDEVFRVRDLWVHAQGDPAILKKPIQQGHLLDRFGLHEKDGRRWVHLSHRAKDGVLAWTRLVRTLTRVAELVWCCVCARTDGSTGG